MLILFFFLSFFLKNKNNQKMMDDSEISVIEYCKEDIKNNNNKNKNETFDHTDGLMDVMNGNLSLNDFLMLRWEGKNETKLIIFQYNILFLILLFTFGFINYIFGIAINFIFIGTNFNTISQIGFNIYISTLLFNIIICLFNSIKTLLCYVTFLNSK